MKLLVLTALLGTVACFGQQYELGGLIGYGTYRHARVNSAAGEATAGIRNRFSAGAVFTENLYEHVSGEISYLYQDGDPFVSLAAAKANIQGQSHAIHYDVLFHAYPRESRFRPYALAGAGGKYYRTTGPAPVPQPFPNIVELAHQNQWRWLVTVGGGVKYRLHPGVLLRGDFVDYISPFPNRLFVPAANATDRGLFQQFTPTFGLSYSF